MGKMYLTTDVVQRLERMDKQIAEQAEILEKANAKIRILTNVLTATRKDHSLDIAKFAERMTRMDNTLAKHENWLNWDAVEQVEDTEICDCHGCCEEVACEEETAVHTESYDCGFEEGFAAGLRKAYEESEPKLAAPLHQRLDIKLDGLVGRITITDAERGEVYVYENSDKF